MRIAVLTNLYGGHAIGGAERVAQDLAEEMARSGHAVSVVCLVPKGETGIEELNGVSVHRLALRNLYWPYPVSRAGALGKGFWHALDSYNPFMAASVGKTLDDIKPDLVHTHNLAGFSVAAWAVAKRRGLPLVHTLHDHYLMCPYATMFKRGHNCERPCTECRIYGVPRASRAGDVDGVVGVSRYILKKHQEAGLFRRAAWDVIHSGYRAPHAAQPTVPRDTGSPLRIGFLGRIDPVKGLDRLLDAFLALPVGSAELRIGGAGDKQYEARLKERTARRTEVCWLGSVEPASLLQEIDVLAVPSLVREGMGRVVVEALSFGVPVIGANRGGIPELIDESCGWVFDPERVGELEAVLQYCVAQRRRLPAMRAAARSRSGRFSLESVASRYLAFYRSVLGSASPAARVSR